MYKVYVDPTYQGKIENGDFNTPYKSIEKALNEGNFWQSLKIKVNSDNFRI